MASYYCLSVNVLLHLVLLIMHTVSMQNIMGITSILTRQYVIHSQLEIGIVFPLIVGTKYTHYNVYD